MEIKNATATQVVNAVRIEQDHGLRRRDCRERRPSGEGASIGSRGESNGMVLVSLEGWEDGVRHMLEFRERGVALPSRRRSKLVPRRAIWDRDFSSTALEPWSSGVRETEESSSSIGEPDERLCIGGGGAGSSSTHRHRDRVSWRRGLSLAHKPSGRVRTEDGEGKGRGGMRGKTGMEGRLEVCLSLGIEKSP